MAFQPAQRQQVQRPQSFAAAPPPIATQQTALPKQPQPQQEKEWILFSPDTHIDARTGTTSSAQTQTAGRSRLSDFGSLDTAAVSERAAGDREDEENEELDSLDDGLHAFNEPSGHYSPLRPGEQSGETVLPTHDGLGKFPGSSSPVQEQFWQHERYNPRRRRQSLRRSSLQRQFEALEDDRTERSTEEERFQRIEQWRLEQSNAILEEIERETRRQRRRSRLSATRRSQSQLSSEVKPTSAPRPTAHSTSQPSQNESFWEKLTRRVIQGLMGIDEATLSYIFGESLPTEETQEPRSRTTEEILAQAEREFPSDALLPATQNSWQERLLARIAKELGLLVNQISEHPGAFSTFLKAKEPPRYAGLPTPPPSPSQQPAELSPASHISTYSPIFAPTLGPLHTHQRRQSSATTADASLWGIEEEDEDLARTPPPEPVNDATRASQQEREYWEKDLDIKMVYRFLRGRLSSSSQQQQSATDTYGTSTSTILNSTATQPRFSNTIHTTSSTAHNDSLRRQALIRHHHPLVSRNHTLFAARASASSSAAAAALVHSTPMQESSSQRPVTPVRRSTMHSSDRVPLSPILGRRQSCDDDDLASCASQSTKKSKTGHSSGASRNYWALGGPGSVGSWGEVW